MDIYLKVVMTFAGVSFIVLLAAIVFRFNMIEKGGAFCETMDAKMIDRARGHVVCRHDDATLSAYPLSEL